MKKIFDFDQLIPGTGCFSKATLNAISISISGLQVGAEDVKEGKPLPVAIADGIVEAFDPNNPSHFFWIKKVSDGGNIICGNYTYPTPDGNGYDEFIFTEDEATNILGNHICGIFRLPEFDPMSLAFRQDLSDAFPGWCDIQRKMDRPYGLGNLAADLGIGKVNPNQEVCIQLGIMGLIWMQDQGCKVNIPADWILENRQPNVVSLKTVMDWTRGNSFAKEIYKEVPDDYDDTKELEAPLSQQERSC